MDKKCLCCRVPAYDENGHVDGVFMLDDGKIIHPSRSWLKLHIDDPDLETALFICMECRHYIITRANHAVISLFIILLLIILF